MLIIFYYPNMEAESHEIWNFAVRIQCSVHNFKEEGCRLPFLSSPLECSFTLKFPRFLPSRILSH